MEVDGLGFEITRTADSGGGYGGGGDTAALLIGAEEVGDEAEKGH